MNCCARNWDDFGVSWGARRPSLARDLAPLQIEKTIAVLVIFGLDRLDFLAFDVDDRLLRADFYFSIQRPSLDVGRKRFFL